MRPQIVVNVAGQLQRRGSPTDTGVAFLVYAAATGTTSPVDCLSAADATATGAPATIAALVGDTLAQGAPRVVLLRAVAASPADVTEAEWDAALAQLTADFGAGQVLIPGVATPAAHAALLSHAEAMSGRVVLLDTEEDATAAEIVTLATALNAAPGAKRAAMFAGWSILPGAGGVERNVPGSIIAAGLCGRGDAIVGHANNAPAGDQGRGAGFVTGAVGITQVFTDAEHDSLHDAGVCAFRVLHGQPQLYGFVSLAIDDPNFRQFNHGRMAMQLTTGIGRGAEQFLFRQIDGEGHLFADLEALLRGYLAPLWAAGALFGADADAAFDVEVASVNTPVTIAAGELHAAVAVSLSPHVEKVVIDVVTNIAEGV